MYISFIEANKNKFHSFLFKTGETTEVGRIEISRELQKARTNTEKLQVKKKSGRYKKKSWSKQKLILENAVGEKRSQLDGCEFAVYQTVYGVKKYEERKLGNNLQKKTKKLGK